MYTVLLVIHTLAILFLIGLILLQKPDADGLGGLGGGGGNILSGRAAGNVLTRATAILAAVFILSSLTLGILTSHRGQGSITDKIADQPAPEEKAPAADAAREPGKPKAPSVPKPE